jgi:hypothetical protein
MRRFHRDPEHMKTPAFDAHTLDRLRRDHRRAFNTSLLAELIFDRSIHQQLSIFNRSNAFVSYYSLHVAAPWVGERRAFVFEEPKMITAAWFRS